MSFSHGAASMPRCGAGRGRSMRRRNCSGRPAVRTISPPTASWLNPHRDICGDWGHECAGFVFERRSMSIVKSLRGQLAPIHPEGYMFVAGFAVATLILWWIWAPLGWLGLVATLWCAYFFRDPARGTPVRADLVISPADGVVSFAGFAAPPPELGLGMAPLQRVSIFMSVFDCHVNRAPVQGRVAQIVYHPGLFLSADLDKASEDNERNSLVIDTPSGRFAWGRTAAWSLGGSCASPMKARWLERASASASSASARALTFTCRRARTSWSASIRAPLLARQ